MNTPEEYIEKIDKSHLFPLGEIQMERIKEMVFQIFEKRVSIFERYDHLFPSNMDYTAMLIEKSTDLLYYQYFLVEYIEEFGGWDLPDGIDFTDDREAVTIQVSEEYYNKNISKILYDNLPEDRTERYADDWSLFRKFAINYKIVEQSEHYNKYCLNRKNAKITEMITAFKKLLSSESGYEITDKQIVPLSERSLTLRVPPESFIKISPSPNFRFNGCCVLETLMAFHFRYVS